MYALTRSTHVKLPSSAASADPIEGVRIGFLTLRPSAWRRLERAEELVFQALFLVALLTTAFGTASAL